MRQVRIVVIGVLALTLALLGCAQPSQAATLTQVTGFGTNPGNLLMYKYVPDGLATGRPLVVALHGCGMTAANYDDETGWTKWADAHQFALVLPQQQFGNNHSRCFNWWLPGDHTRGQGEPLSVKQMVDYAVTNFGTDSTKVFVTGLSAGGAMTSDMLGTYPDVFKAGAVVAGVPYKCAVTAQQTTACNNGTKNLTPVQWGDLVRNSFGYTGPWPRVSLWHGTADLTVKPAIMNESMEQWTNVHGIDQTADVTDTVAGYPHKVYKDAGGTALVESYSITGMGHGQPVDPGTGATQCGNAITYSLDANICASFHIGQWFGIIP